MAGSRTEAAAKLITWRQAAADPKLTLMGYPTSTLIILTTVSWLSTIFSFFAVTSEIATGVWVTIIVVGVWIPIYMTIRDILSSGRIRKGKRANWVAFVLCSGPIGMAAYTVRATKLQGY